MDSTKEYNCGRFRHVALCNKMAATDFVDVATITGRKGFLFYDCDGL